MQNTNSIALDRHAYSGAPRRNPRCAWPDDVLHPSLWHRDEWQFDELLKTHATRQSKPSFTRDTALDLLNKLLTK